MADGSVSVWMRALREGDQQAAANIWQRYCNAMVRIAARAVAPKYRRMADQEDAVQSAFDSLFERAKLGGFLRFSNRQDLWRLLVTITRRKAINIVNRERRIKRSGSMLGSDNESVRDSARRHLASWIAPDGAVSPEAELVMAETIENLWSCLPDDDARLIAESKLAGLTSQQIADKVGCSQATVCRRLRVIRQLWLAYYREDSI